MKLSILTILTAMLALSADLTKEVSARTVTVDNTTNTAIFCPLEGAKFIQVLVPPAGTDQVFTITNEDGTTIEVISGGTYELLLRTGCSASDRLFRVQTATGSTVFQVIGMREKS